MNHSAHATAEQFETAEQQKEASTLGIWVFLSTEIMFFGPLFLSYIYGRLHDAQSFSIASHHTNIWLGTLNTAVLLTSSLTMALSVRAAQTGRRDSLARLLAITALLGTIFLIIKGTEYYQEWQEGLVPVLHFSFFSSHQAGVEIFFYLYFLMTGLHGLHLIIGIGIVLTMLRWALLNRFNQDYYTPVEVTGLYWHFIDIVWIFLYPLLYLLERYQ